MYMGSGSQEPAARSQQKQNIPPQEILYPRNRGDTGSCAALSSGKVTRDSWSRVLAGLVLWSFICLTHANSSASLKESMC